MNDDDLCKALKRLSYISSPSYISFLYHLLRGDNDPLFEEDFTRLNMFYYSLYQDTPDVIGFKNPMDFVLSLREHTDGLKEFLDFLSIQYSERKPLKNKIDLGYDCVLDLYSRYSRNEILAAFDYWNWSKRPSMREGVIYLPDKKTDLFFVTLKKTEDEYSSTTTYEDYFIDKEQFHWQSQNTTPDTSSVGQRYINHVEMGTQVLLFVREQKMKEGKSVPYVFLGKVSYVKHEGSKPMNIIWKLEKPVPDDVYAEFSVERGAAVDDTEIKNTDESLNNVQEAIPDYHVQEGFYPPISIENLDSSSDLLENNNGVVEFEVKIVKKDVKSLIVFAGNAVATLKKDFLGYTIGTYSSILRQELDLSEKVLATRDSLKNIQHLSLCSFDPTLLRLTNSCTLPTFPLALEMITGCRKDESPTFDALPTESVWIYSYDKARQTSSVIVQLLENVKDKVGIDEENTSIPKEKKLESLSREDELPIMRDGDSKKINMDTGFENPHVTTDMGHDEGKQSLTADSTNDNSSSLILNYSISLEGELLLIKSGNASTKVKKANGRYFLLPGSTFNNNLRTLATHDALKQKQKLIFEGYLTSISHSLWELESFNAVFDNLHTIVEMVAGFPCDPNEVLTKESELFGRREGEVKEEIPALNVESSELIDSIETPEFLSIYSWDLVGFSASKHVDKSVINYNGSGIPMEICPFFEADALNHGDKILLTLQYGGKNFTGHIIKEQIIPGVKHPRTRIFWDKDLGEIIREYFKEACGDCIIKFYKTENNKNFYVLDFFIIDSSKLLDEVNQRDSLVKITKKYIRNPILKLELGKISARFTYYSKENYYVLHFGSIISSVVVPPIKFGGSDKRILIRERKLLPKLGDARLLSVDQSIRYSSLNEVLSNIFGIQCSVPYAQPFDLPLKGMYRLPDLELVEESITTRQINTTTPLIKVESIDEETIDEETIDEEPVDEIDDPLSELKLETEEDAQYLNKELRHILKVLGIPNASAKIIAALMIYGELPISGLSAKCNTLNKDYITLDIKAAIKRGDITFYSKANTKGRVITYYKLVHSHADIYMNLLSKNNHLVTQLSEMIHELATLLSLGDQLIIASPDIKIETTDEFKNIILKLSEIGIERDIASVLVYLHYYPRTPFPQMFMGTSFDSSHKLKALQALYGVNWLRSTDYSYEVLHSLNLELNEIAQEYVSQHIESINLALKDLKCIIQLLDEKSLEKEDTKQLGSSIKSEMNDGENLSNIIIHSPERIVSCSDPYKEAVLEKDVLIKRVDNTLLNNNFFVIPNTILSFFNAENLSKGEKKEITLTYHRQYFKATVYKKDTSRGVHNKATIFNWDESFKAKIKENIVDYNNLPLLMITQSFVDDDEYDIEVKIVE